MKTNSKKKILVSTLALAMGAGLAGSISGSVAWYQYSTRTTAQLQGVSTGTVRDLKVRIARNNQAADEGWQSDLSFDEIKTFLGIGGDGEPTELVLNPVTIQTTGLAKNAALATKNAGADLDFRGHPVYQYDNLPAITSMKAGTGLATTFNYVQIPLEFDLTDNKGSGATRIEKDVYLVDSFFVDSSDENHEDITPALRAHFSSAYTVANPDYDENDENSQQRLSQGENALLAKTATSTAVSGALDLNGIDDEDKYGFDGLDAQHTKEGNYINYGNPEHYADALPFDEEDILTQNSYNASETANTGLLANDSDAFTFTNKVSLGKTTTEGNFLKVTLTIWLEGWSELEGSNLWDADYIGSDFGLQLRFACEADA